MGVLGQTVVAVGEAVIVGIGLTVTTTGVRLPEAHEVGDPFQVITTWPLPLLTPGVETVLVTPLTSEVPPAPPPPPPLSLPEHKVVPKEPPPPPPPCT